MVGEFLVTRPEDGIVGETPDPAASDYHLVCLQHDDSAEMIIDGAQILPNISPDDGRYVQAILIVLSQALTLHGDSERVCSNTPAMQSQIIEGRQARLILLAPCIYTR